MEEKLKRLEKRVDELIDVCDQLRRENEKLRGGQETLLQEHTSLTERNKLAKSKLEEIIGRLKSLEQA